MEFLNVNKLPKLEPKAGRMLISEPFLHDPNFGRSVVFLCECGEDGTVGFILNRPTKYSLNDVLDNVNAPELKIYEGGPVNTDSLHLLHRMGDELGGKEVMQGIYLGGSYEKLKDIIIDHNYAPTHIRLFAGYAGWSPGQLENEIKQGAWLVAEALKELIFETEPEQIWAQAVRSLGDDFTFLSNMPTDPQLN